MGAASAPSTNAGADTAVGGGFGFISAGAPPTDDSNAAIDLGSFAPPESAPAPAPAPAPPLDLAGFGMDMTAAPTVQQPAPGPAMDLASLSMAGAGDAASAPVAAPAAIDLASFGMMVAPAASEPAPAAIDLTSFGMGSTTASASEPAPLVGATTGSDMLGLPALDPALLAMGGAGGGGDAPPPKPKKKKKGFKLGAAASRATNNAPHAPPRAEAETTAVTPALGVDLMDAQAAPAAVLSADAVSAPAAAPPPQPSTQASVKVPKASKATKAAKADRTLEQQIADKQKKIASFIEAQIKIQKDTDRLTGEVEEARVQLSAMESELEAAIAAEDFAKSGEIQQRSDVCKAMLRKKQVEVTKNEARNQKGEDAKLKQSKLLIELRERLLAQLVASRLDVVQQTTADLESRVGKLVAGEGMIADSESQIASNHQQIEQDTAKLDATVSDVEEKVAARTAPEQEKKKVQEEALAVVDGDIAELERQLAAKREERAGVLARMDLIEKTIQLERDNFSSEYEEINVEKARLGALTQSTCEQEAQVQERSSQLETFRDASMQKRAEYVMTVQAAQAREDEQHAAIALLKWYMAEGQKITAGKEKRDHAEVPIIEAVESLKLELGTFKAQNQEYATAMLESQRALSQLKRDIESAARELPELEAQKKLAVQARNFDEAQRVSTAIKALEAAKEANEAKKVVVETEIAAKQEANAETNRELQKLEEAVDSKEKELGSHKLDTLCAQVGTLKGLAESARMDGDDVAARLLETQVDIANRAVTGLTRAYDLALDEIVAVRPERPAPPSSEPTALPAVSKRKVVMTAEEARQAMEGYEPAKAEIEARLEAAIEAEDFGSCGAINAELAALTEARDTAAAVLGDTEDGGVATTDEATSAAPGIDDDVGTQATPAEDSELDSMASPPTIDDSQQQGAEDGQATAVAVEGEGGQQQPADEAVSGDRGGGAGSGHTVEEVLGPPAKDCDGDGDGDGDDNGSEAVLSTEQAQEILSQVAALEKKLSAAIDDEDFGACGGINAQLEKLAPKKAVAEALLSSD
jgi:hypothetical protein|eukprot:COSAG01_NODE_1972_length_8757_cov_109.482559_5_plen_1044_part_00